MTVLLSLAFIGAYYFFYFRANDLVRQIVRNAEIYGEKIKGAACWLFLFGRIGEGDWFAAALFTAVTAALCALVWFAMSRSFRMWMDGKDPGTLLGELNGLLRDVLMIHVAPKGAEDLILAAVNGAIKLADDKTSEAMAKLQGGMGMGGFPGFF